MNIAIRKFFRVVILMSNSCHSLLGWSCFVDLTSPPNEFLSLSIAHIWRLGFGAHENRKVMAPFDSHTSLAVRFCFMTIALVSSGGWSPTSGRLSLCGCLLCGCLACFDFRTRFGFCRSRSWVCCRWRGRSKELHTCLFARVNLAYFA